MIRKIDTLAQRTQDARRATNFMPYEEKRAFGDVKTVTLDGKPARVIGYKNPFATVETRDGRLDGEWSWAGVKHVIENCGGAFKL